MMNDNMIPEGLNPYRIGIIETYIKEVEIYAEDSLAAEQMAEDLCNNGDIDLDYENFVERKTECRGIARPIDLDLHQVFGLDQNKVSVGEDIAFPANESDTTVKNLISAMAAYGVEHSLCDSDIIESLVSLGITYEDFCNVGARDFAKDYFEEKGQRKTSLNEKMASAASKAKIPVEKEDRNGLMGHGGR